MKRLFFLLSIIPFVCFSQRVDSTYHVLQEVEITPSSAESKLRILSSEQDINHSDLEKQSSLSLLPAINNIPGVRMEERSPGSYRLSFRGSLLRSPFGVRNLKIYMGDLPFTDAGGNTYLNSIDPGNINGLKILKGPEVSIFGSNTGGALIIDPVYKSPDSLKIIASVVGGSYQTLHQNFLVQVRSKRSLFTISQGYQASKGYRKNSEMQRHYAQISEILSYRPGSQLRVLVLFSDLNYQTPGGLTLAQYQINPRQARPSTATLPGAEEQKAAISNKMVFGGITHDHYFSKNFKHVISIFGSYTDFKNPFITNYEQRFENSVGARTYIDGSIGNPDKIFIKWNVGGEMQQTSSGISNFENITGSKGLLQASDEIKATQAFAFSRVLLDIKQHLLFEASLSYNLFSYDYKNIHPFSDPSFRKNKFDAQLMPRLAASYKFNDNLVLRSSIGRGYSPPTISEIRSSDNIINTNLQAETGINLESGVRIKDNKDYFWLDVAVFRFELTNAIVRRLNDNGTEYFINAGGTKQSGLEAQTAIQLLKPRATGFIRAIEIKGNVTWNKFLFQNYKINGLDYSDNRLTGVPDFTSCENISVSFPMNLGLYVQYYYASNIPLNDANTVKAKEYHLVQVKADWKKDFKKFMLKVNAGIDNVLDEKYSLGNDLNAAGARYYNAAAGRNYFVGLSVEF